MSINNMYLSYDLSYDLSSYNDIAYLVSWGAYYLCISLMLHSIYMDIKQGILSKNPTLIYYYEDRDYICRYVSNWFASLF